MFNFKKAIQIIAILLLSSPSLVAEESAPRHVPSNERVFWEDYLYDAFHSLGYYFTIEIVTRKLDDPKFRGIYILDDEEVRTVDEIILKASKSLKDFTFAINKQNPRVIHVIDNDLRKLSDYAVDQQMSLKYSGTTSNLSRSIQKTFPTLVPRTSGDIAKNFDDHVTKVEFDVKNETVRDILTNHVPLKRYNPLIWRAETQEHNGKRETIVQYYGPLRE